MWGKDSLRDEEFILRMKARKFDSVTQEATSLKCVSAVRLRMHF